MRLRRRRRAGLGALLAVALGLAACGVEVPDDVAERATGTTTTTEGAPATTEVPRSDDELEQALIDNGYSLDEARCGAERLRTELPDDEIREIIEADAITDISPRAAADFAAALRPCVTGEEDDEGEGGDEDDGRPDGGVTPGLPDIGDDSRGDVSRSRFLAALLAAGAPDEQARCIVDAVYATFDQGVVNDIFRARSPDDLPAGVERELAAIVDGCR